MQFPRHILVVEDERHIADVVEFLLEEHGFHVHRAENTRAAEEIFHARKPDLVLLDLGLPGAGGLELFKRLRAHQEDLPVIMLTARNDEVDRILGLEMGADDYVTKPFCNRELVARINAVLRRSKQSVPEENTRLRSGPLCAEVDCFYLTYYDQAVQLPRHEFLLLATLMKHPAHVFSREQLQQRMYGDSGGVTPRAVDTAVRRIRKRLMEIQEDLNPVEAVYGLGYRLATALGKLP